MDDYIFGRNAVLEFLRSGKEGDKLYLQKGMHGAFLNEVYSLAKQQGLPVVQTDRGKLDKMAEGGRHQGLVLLAPGYQYAQIQDMLDHAEQAGHAPFLILLDEVTDPHNLGAIIRTAECAGADGVLIPKRRSAAVTSVVHKTSAGADSYMRVGRVNNINQTIERLKKKNIWVYGAAGEAKADLWSTDFSGGVCLVIGNEGKGLASHTRELCDQLVSIPMFGHLDSLNASTSASILIYEVLRGRLGK